MTERQQQIKALREEAASHRAWSRCCISIEWAAWQAAAVACDRKADQLEREENERQ